MSGGNACTITESLNHFTYDEISGADPCVYQYYYTMSMLLTHPNLSVVVDNDNYSITITTSDTSLISSLTDPPTWYSIIITGNLKTLPDTVSLKPLIFELVILDIPGETLWGSCLLNTGVFSSSETPIPQ